MKVLNTITVCIFFSLLIISCGEDEPMEMEMEMEDPITEELDGEWSATSFDLNVTQTNTILGLETVTTVQGTGKNLNYNLKLDNGAFTTNGAYDMDITVDIAGQSPIMLPQSYTDLSGQGTYVSTTDSITIVGQLIEFEVDGVYSVGETTEPGFASYVIDGDVLTINQEQTEVTEEFGLTSTTKIISNSTWARK